VFAPPFIVKEAVKKLKTSIFHRLGKRNLERQILEQVLLVNIPFLAKYLIMHYDFLPK